MRPSHQLVEVRIREIEAEMRRIGMWQEEPLTGDQLEVKAAFGADRMTFEQWLQFVFIPRVREIVEAGGTFPSGSEVAAQAYREWKMWGDRNEVDGLLALLREFDALF